MKKTDRTSSQDTAIPPKFNAPDDGRVDRNMY
jgi:hypothetical protein